MTRRSIKRNLFAALCIVASVAVSSTSSHAAEPPAVDFARDIRPILSDHCFACHGPDEHDRQADVRLDSAEGIADVVDADDWAASLLIDRIEADDVDVIMPPPRFHKPLSETQIELLRRWVSEGAAYESHWAFTPPRRHTIENARPGADTVDQHVEAKLVEVGLSPGGRADRRTLARRVALDLTGLPPTVEQVETFAADESPNAYETLVDQLIASPNYGEHMARYWLDLVRYGDTHGLHLDNYREMWPYRDWVIESFNQNMPLDQFITRQLAGDLLPEEATPEQTLANQIASGFNRLNVTTSEGGSIYEEVFARNVIDRTDSFGTIFLGLTTGCAVCHDHKFDPITQKDYYSLSAYFNSLDGQALDGNKKDHPPVVRAPSPDQTAELAEIDREIANVDQQIAGPLAEVDAAQLVWQRSLGEPVDARHETITPSEVTTDNESKTVIEPDHSVRWDGMPAAKDVMRIVADLPTGDWRVLQLHAMTDEANPRVGTSPNKNAVLSELKLETRADQNSPWTEVLIQSAKANIEQSGDQFAVSKSIDGKIDGNSGWAVAGHEQEGDRTAWFVAPDLARSTGQIRISLHYESVFASHMLRQIKLSLHSSMNHLPADQRIAMGDVHVVGPLPIESAPQGFEKVFAGEDKDSFDAAVPVQIDGRDYQWQHRGDVVSIVANALPTIPDHASVTVMHQIIQSPSEQTVNLLLDTDEGHVVYFNGKEITKRQLTNRADDAVDPLSNEHELSLKKGDNHLYIRHVNRSGDATLTYAVASPAIEFPNRLKQRLAGLPDSETTIDTRAARTFYRDVVCEEPQWTALHLMRAGMVAVRKKLNDSIPTTLVWKETKEPRQAHILMRGEYDAPGEAVDRAVPGFLPPLPDGAPNDRLGLAKWLLRDDHPLTSRVAVNRFWQQLFGHGLVKSSEDFGSQGTMPSHPKLLDELAIDFRESGWDVKAFMKRLVLTDAYQRDATATPMMLTVDPNNRMVARGPRFRLDAEMLRDQTLALAGNLVDKRGGPSVKPPQPAGLWEAVGYTGSDTANFVPDEGEKIHRRSVYTFWKRTSAPAVMSTFDAPSRESCTARRERTNTPMQALLMLNETQTMTAAKTLARDAIEAPTPDPSDWKAVNRQRLRTMFQRITLRPIEANELQALEELLIDLTAHYNERLDEATKLTGTPNPDLAAWTVLTSTLLNLDEVVCK